MLMQIIQTIATAGAVLLGLTYIIGGLIVNLNLARRGIVEYQILKVKYLVVGIIFLLQCIGVMVFAAIPAFFLVAWTYNILFTQVINVISMLAALALLWVWSRNSTNTKPFFREWRFWFIGTSISAIFPMVVLISQLLVPRWVLPWGIVLAQAILTSALTFMASLYHYSAFYYGRTYGLALDPIGIGVPTRVRFAGETDKLRILESLGLPVEKGHVTGDLNLIDETDRHYIVSFQTPSESGTSEQTLKVDKDLVKAILYRPEHVIQIEKKLNRSAGIKKKTKEYMVEIPEKN